MRASVNCLFFLFITFEVLKKILIIRFSSIGDIVLTTPVIRCLKNKYPDSEIHFLTKSSFKSVVESNPHIEKVWTIKQEVKEVISELEKIGFDHIIDLHKNIRSKQVRLKLKASYSTFSKLNFQKWLLTNFKINKMPNTHIVDRYIDAGNDLGIVNDNKGLDFFINPKNEVKSPFPDKYIALVIGTAHATKALTAQKTADIIEALSLPVVLIGGPGDTDKAEEIIALSDGEALISTCGDYNIEQSASILKQAELVIAPDTGMMHIASALQKPIISIWGNTVPEFGMYPYIPQNKAKVHIVEVTDLDCRPCSKIGFESCPKKHFNCINNIDVEEVKNIVDSIVSSH
tara:strand:- start:1843 stop:2877 length:1035 start_codon:yes stop_codon:yes gene_type:complete